MEENSLEKEGFHHPQAQEIVHQATAKRDAQLEQTRQEIAQWIADAQQNAHEQAEKEAQGIEAKIKMLQGSMQEEMRTHAISIAVDMAKNLLKEKLIQAPETIVQVAQIAFESIHDVTQVVLRVSSVDLGIMRSHAAALSDSLGPNCKIEVREDKQLMRGGLLIHTNVGVIDAQIETQLEEIKQALEKKMQQMGARKEEVSQEIKRNES